MTDMPYLTYDQCVTLGLTPYAVYGSKVYSFLDDGQTIPHGSVSYAIELDRLKLLEMGAA